ncbi:hypothetical protein CC86DRAFT_188610 [Ophiobolus disseminans]|uniref:Uncharacterized protein n=1 Tax=Ophiobolus disseminans TaxID=1469910 RepID=A0A6A7A9H9_9PLEO|nr:hypothetical protein CC86DRAFT_188610 [Ophiobolus disseminans]
MVLNYLVYPANVVTMSRDEVLDWDTAISLLEDFRVAMRYTIELGKIRARFNDAKLDFIYQFVAIRDVNHQIEDQLDQHQSRRVRRYATNSQATSGMSHLAIENADDSSGALVFQNNSYAGFNSHDTLPRFNSPPAINATTSFLPATPSSGRLSGNVGGNRKKGHFK